MGLMPSNFVFAVSMGIQYAVRPATKSTTIGQTLKVPVRDSKTVLQFFAILNRKCIDHHIVAKQWSNIDNEAETSV